MVAAYIEDGGERSLWGGCTYARYLAGGEIKLEGIAAKRHDVLINRIFFCSICNFKNKNKLFTVFHSIENLIQSV